MKRNIKFDPSQNPAKSFELIVKDLEEIAQDTDTPMVKILDMFILDLQNHFNEDYEKKIKEITLKDFDSNILNSLNLYINKVRRAYKQKENKERKKEKTIEKQAKTQEMEAKWLEIEKYIGKTASNGKEGIEKEIVERLILDINQGKSDYKFDSKSKKYILKNLKERLNSLNKREVQKRNAEEAIKQIEEVVEREYSEGNIQNKVSYLTSIKNAIMGKKGNIDINIKKEEIAEDELFKMLDNRINMEKDELYYQQVKSFTNNFQFLRDYSEVAKSINRVRNKKFTDKESYDRFCSLRESLQKEYNEDVGIKLLLETGKLSSADERILTARKSVIEKEKIQRKSEVTK